MRILYVSHSFPPADRPLANMGGMQRVAQGLLGALERHPEVEVTPLVLRTSWRATHLRTPLFLARLLRAVPRYVASGEIDVVLFSSLVTASTAPWLRRRLRTLRVGRAVGPFARLKFASKASWYPGRRSPTRAPGPTAGDLSTGPARSAAPALVSVAHGRDVMFPVGIYQRCVPRVFAALDAVLAVSRAAGEACTARGLPAARLHVVGNGVDPGLEAPSRRDVARAALRAWLEHAGHAVPGDAMLVCSVGRHVERKGFGWFVRDVMPRLPGDVHYLLAGEGPETRAIRAKVTARGLRDRVHLLGPIADHELQWLYQGADLFVMPNLPVAGDLEGFGLVLVEAALSGMPVVAAAVDGIREVVRDGESGTLVTGGDAREFAAAILAYRDPARRASVGSQAARYARERFSWSAVADRYVRALASIRRGAVTSPTAE